MELGAERIIRDFSSAGGLPRGALEAAILNREAVTPAFLETLERHLSAPELADSQRDQIFFIVHLLAQFRERRAYPLLMRLLSLDPDEVDRTLGDAVIHTLSRIVISLFDGNPNPMCEVIENPRASPLVRGGLLEVLGYLAREGRIERHEATRYLLSCYWRLEPQRSHFVWIGWQKAISLLGLVEFRSLVRRAFDSGKIDPRWMRFEHFQEDLWDSLRGEDSDPYFCEKFGRFDDTIGELATWYLEPEENFVSEEFLRWLRNTPLSELFDPPTEEPVVNPHRHVGRNDPCPCGSGRKYKKCCLH